MLRKVALAAGVILFSFLPARAQFYPTQYRPDVNWQQLSTDHFLIVFPQGEGFAARETARILETQYPGVQKITGGSLRNFPVILTNYNDRSNGLVTSLHFRSEIDIPPIQGKTLNPQTGGWLQNVVPHELVHALQFSNTGGVGLGQLIKPFSPDLARALHGASPAGIQEGLATYYESEFVTPSGGRGNYPFFINQFNAVFDSPERWSMGQMVHFPADTRPFNRHYIGGYAFTQWLQDTYGEQASRNAIDFHVRWPFLGYGVALKHATGQWPSQLYDQFENETTQRLADLKDSAAADPIPISLDGADIRRPQWLSDSTLIFYGSFYNANPGFYRYDLSAGSLTKMAETTMTSDYRYSLSDDGQTLWYGYYRPDAVYSNANKTRLVKLNTADGSTQKLPENHRLFSPTVSGDSLIYALQTHHTYSQLVEVLPGASSPVKTLFSDPGRQLAAVAAHPHSDSLAVVMNAGGTQGIWLTDRDHLQKDLRKKPVISFKNGSVFDPAWHPNGGRLLFSADFSGALQVYEYDVTSGAVTRWTHAPFNAFEASYSPNGNRIAYVVQRGNERLPAVKSRDAITSKIITPPSYSFSEPDTTMSPRPKWEQKPYHTGVSWLKPRTVLPVIKEISGSDRYRWGAGFHSSDLLQQQAYSADFSTAENRFWYDLTYRNKQFFPGFKVRAFNEPAFRTFRLDPDASPAFTQRFLRQERSVALSMPMPLTLEQNVDFTSFYVEPEIRWSQLRYMTENGDDPSDFSVVAVGNIFTQLNYKLEQNIRDVQPTGGVRMYGELEHYFKSASVTLPTRNGPQPVEFARPTALRGGIFIYTAPFARWNQSLRLGLEGLTQTNPLFDIGSVFTDTFSDPAFPTANNLLRFSSRYTVPLWFPDDGGLLLPLYLSNVYLVGFSDTVTDPTARSLINSSRSVFGAGLRLRFRISNLPLDIGIGIGVEPSRNKIHYFIGDF